MVSVRPGSAADAPALAALHRTGFDQEWSAGGMIGLLAQPGTFAFLAELEGAPCGFVLARVAADEAEILSVAVAPAARRRGAGRKLLEAAMAEAARRAVSRLFLEVAVDNRAALGLYAALGFIETGRRKAYYAREKGPAADALVLKRDLMGRR
jgi:ribosomal-protein-alanine N-acetyltransferase